jgi:hypothetical protein
MTPKTAPCFVHSGWYQNITPMTLPAPACIHSATQTAFIAGPLGFIIRTNEPGDNTEPKKLKIIWITY